MTAVQLHGPALGVDAEDAGEAIAKGHDRAVEDAVGDGQMIVVDDWVAAVAPDDAVDAWWARLPGNLWQRGRCSCLGDRLAGGG